MTASPLHQIFVSHSGQQKGFVRDLCRNLCSCSYTVFFDEDTGCIPAAEPFPPPIKNAAETCELAIVVISRDFLTSRWPMLELCMFAKRIESKDPPILLLPLFFKLSPADIEIELEETSEQYWEKLEKEDKHKRFSANECKRGVQHLLRHRGVERSPEALEGETTYINRVVEHVLDILPIHCNDTLRKQLPGINRLYNVIVEKLKNSEENPAVKACVLGVYGILGCGKSTLCRFLCDLMRREFRGKVLHLEFKSEESGNIKSKYEALLSMLFPYRQKSPPSTSEQMSHELRASRCEEKIFLVLDGLSSSNSESSIQMAHAILSSSILRHGSKVVLVARSLAIIQTLWSSIQKNGAAYSYSYTEVPCLNDAEAMEAMLSHYPTGDSRFKAGADLLSHVQLLAKSSFQSCSFKYIPFVFYEMGRRLHERLSYHTDMELEAFEKMVDRCRKDVVQTLVEKYLDLMQLPPHLQGVDRHSFVLDICLFSLPAKQSRLQDAIFFLKHTHEIRKDKVNQMIFNLENHGLAIRSDANVSNCQREIHMCHDVFIEYARYNFKDRIPTFYVIFDPDSTPFSSCSTSASQNDQNRAHLNRQYQLQEAWRLFLGAAQPADLDPGVCFPLDVNLENTAKALLMRNHRSHGGEYSLRLSGILSSLVWLGMNNVQGFAISLSGSNGGLSNLRRLEWKNEYISSSSLDSIHHQSQERNNTLSSESYHELVSSGQMRKLRVLILTNVGMHIQRLEVNGSFFPELKVLEVSGEAHQLMSISICNPPKLKRLVITPSRRHYIYCWPPSTLLNDYCHHCTDFSHLKSNQLALQLSECPKLEQLYADGSSFHQVRLKGSFPQNLRHLKVKNHKSVETITTNFFLSSLTKLVSLDLSCTMVEKMDFTDCHLPSLKRMVLHCCISLTHLSVDTDCSPELVGLIVDDCSRLQAIYGVEKLLTSTQKARTLKLRQLPHLECRLIISWLREHEISVDACPNVIWYKKRPP